MGKGTDKMSINQFRALQADNNRRDDNQAGAKYGNRFTLIDGINFHSGKEARYYGKLKLRVLAKDLVRFERQKKYILKVNDVVVAVYIADYVEYFPSGKVEVIDIKSVITREIESYKIKKKLMFAVFGITVIEK